MPILPDYISQGAPQTAGEALAVTAQPGLVGQAATNWANQNPYQTNLDPAMRSSVPAASQAKYDWFLRTFAPLLPGVPPQELAQHVSAALAAGTDGTAIARGLQSTYAGKFVSNGPSAAQQAAAAGLPPPGPRVEPQRPMRTPPRRDQMRSYMAANPQASPRDANLALRPQTPAPLPAATPPPRMATPAPVARATAMQAPPPLPTAGIGLPRTGTAAVAPAPRPAVAPAAPLRAEALPNVAGQVGPVGVRSGVVNGGLSGPR
jgi:hypothetical protein